MKRAVVYAESEVARAGIASVLETGTHFRVTTRASALSQLEPLDFDVLVAALSDRDYREVMPVLEQAPAVVVLADGDPDLWLELGLRLGGFAVLESTASADQILAAAWAAASGLFAVRPTRLSILGIQTSEDVPTVPTGDRLTPRESEVLAMLAEGLGNKTIAYRLGISDHTVKFHVGSILRKLDAESRTEAVRNGIRQGYVSV